MFVSLLQAKTICTLMDAHHTNLPNHGVMCMLTNSFGYSDCHSVRRDYSGYAHSLTHLLPQPISHPLAT